MSTAQTGITHEVETDLEGGKTRYSYFEAKEAVLRPLMDDLFANHWSHIVIGPCLEGVVFEIQFESSEGHPLGWVHDRGSRQGTFHMCIGPTKSSKSEEVRQKRPVAKAALFESRGVGHGRSWGMQFWNGFGEQMATVFLPNAQLTDDMQWLKQPDWNRLRFYYELRERLLGEAIPADFGKAANEEWPG